MKLNELSPPKGARTARKRKGRGPGSGLGKTAGKGHKGQKARSGGGVRPGFEGGQMPVHRRLPKRGFCNIFAKKIAAVNVRDLARFEADSVVDAAALREARLISGKVDGVKILGHGEITQALTVKADQWSESAKEKIEKAGGKIEAA
ncbi:50S ribosomal protein L15 [Desulfatibacillum aliphaticivorans]|uniref:Large ribosomal subunit protein uL15 n=1 Tax=Desulfatibacillum aliphaticivorans TaxID=218208 RepID=RL15_DESAL|nr:50S ribosomal protein L15 [Desulfatibacillum aliphaticivorans]B8FER6.1 RecName: Full=Large ribosomal subunit protein uL15; AltName: Full=50S ribosomal protein L15 [Desulfatibacillum aliphaticivorans]ACL03593.1 ribosomal protein L15 [Desulfatibacillum aliphaticivorans]